MKTHLQRQKVDQWSRGSKKRETFVHCWWECTWCRQHAEQYRVCESRSVMAKKILEWVACPFSSKSPWAIREQYRGPPKKLKIESPYDPAVPLLGILYIKNKTKTSKTLIQKDTCTPMFRAALFTIVEIRKQPKCPSPDNWMKKTWEHDTPRSIYGLPSRLNW